MEKEAEAGEEHTHTHWARLIEALEKFERWRGGEMCKRLTGWLVGSPRYKVKIKK